MHQTKGASGSFMDNKLTWMTAENSSVREGQISADSVEKVGFSDHLNSVTATTREPTHHIEWFLGPSLTIVALLLG
jgi:hypothetical protein